MCHMGGMAAAAPEGGLHHRRRSVSLPRPGARFLPRPSPMSATIHDLPDALLGRILGLCGLYAG